MKNINCLLAMGMAVVLGGCATAPQMTKSPAPSSNAMKTQMAEFSTLGGVSMSDSSLKLVVPGDSLFKKGSSSLTADGIRKIADLAVVLSKHPDDSVTVAVYTDSSGTDAKNLKLSQRRADRIKKELVKQGLSADRVMVEGKGSSDPVAANDTEDGRARNRRAEFDVVAAKS